MKKTEWDYGYETAEADDNRELVDIEEMLSGTVDIPTEDYLAMVRDGIEYPDAREYWEGYNARVEEDLEPDYGGGNKDWLKNYSLLTADEREELAERLAGGEVEPLPKRRRDMVDLYLKCTGRRITGVYLWGSEDWEWFEVEPEELVEEGEK